MKNKQQNEMRTTFAILLNVFFSLLLRETNESVYTQKFIGKIRKHPATRFVTANL